MAAAAAEGLHAAHSSLPLWMALIPMILAGPVYALACRNARLAGYVSVAAGLGSVGLGLIMLPSVAHGILEFSVRALGSAVHMRADAFSLGIALLAALGWSLALLFSVDYMGHAHRVPRYYAFMLFTMGSTLGVFLAGELITLFVFFELMTFASYALVVHEETGEAMAAGRTFLTMGVIGGLALIFGIMILGHAGSIGLTHSLADNLHGYLPLVTILVLVGFGMKAGMVPVHIWLPQAHPVAPAPASAVLSGVLIKAGAYGLIRMFLIVLAPGGHGAEHVVNPSGMILLGIGLVTIIAGGIMGMFQVNAKRILAYSSISQMGYILTGVGAAAVLGDHGPMGFGGAYFHMMNHVVFKGTAFLAIGYAYMITHNLDIRKMSGLARHAPMAALALTAAFGAITGLPGFSGFASKTMIHHALVEAYHETHLASMYWAEKAFVVGSSLTAVYFLRLLGIFWGRRRGHVESKPYPAANIALGVCVVLIMFAGLFPATLLNSLVLPACHLFQYDHHALAHVHHLDHDLFIWANVRDVLIPFGLGLAMYLIASALGLFRRSLPGWLSVEGLVYRPLAAVAWLATGGVGGRFEKLAFTVTALLCRAVRPIVRMASVLDRGVNVGYGELSRFSRHGIVSVTAALDGRVDRAYDGLSRHAASGVVQWTAALDGRVDDGYELMAKYARDAVVERTADLDRAVDDGYETMAKYARDVVVERTADFDRAVDDGCEAVAKYSRDVVVERTADLDRVVDEGCEGAVRRATEAVVRLDDDTDSDRYRPRAVWDPSNLNVGTLILALMLVSLTLVFFVARMLRTG